MMLLCPSGEGETFTNLQSDAKIKQGIMLEFQKKYWENHMLFAIVTTVIIIIIVIIT